MNRRILKKMNKATKNRLKKLPLNEGDTIVARVDMDAYDPHDLYELFNIMNRMAKARGCHLWVVPKEIDIDKLTEEEVEVLKSMIKEWESLNSEERPDNEFIGGY